MKNKKFYLQLFTIYAITIFVYTLVFVIMFFYKNSEIMQLELSNGQKQFIEQTKEKIDTKYVIGQTFVQQLVANKDVIAYSNSNMDGNNNLYITNIFDEIKTNVSTFSNLGFTIALTKMTDNIVITPAHTIKVTPFFEEMGFNDSDTNEISNYILNERNSNNFLTIRSTSSAGEKFFTIVRKEKIQNKNQVIFFISYLESMFLPEISRLKNQSFAILRDNNPIIFQSNGNTENLRQILSSPAIKQIKKNIKDPFAYQKVQFDQYHAYCISSQKTGWDYLFIAPKSVLNKKIKVLVANSMKIYMALLVFGVGFTYLVTNRIYRPIENILKISNVYNSAESKDELLFIRNTIDTMSKTNEKLNEIVKNNTLPLKEKFIKDLLYGLVPYAQTQEDLKKNALTWMNDSITVIMLECTMSKETEEILSKDELLTIQLKIISLLKNKMGFNKHFEVVQLHYKRYVMLTEETRIPELKKILSSVISDIEADLEISMTACIGHPCTSIRQVEKSFANILNIEEYKFVLGNKMVVSFDDFEGIQKETYYYPMETEKNLISYVIDGKKSETHALLNYVLDQNLAERNLNQEALSQFIFSLVNTMNRIMQQLNKTIDEFFDEGTVLYIELKMCQSPMQLKEKVIEIFNRFLSHISDENNKLDNTLSNNMIAFIQENYKKDLALADISQHFNLSTSYVSTLFKNFTGKNFKDYLNIYRVEKAKEILYNRPDIKIKELAELVGCNNTISFIRIFKRYEGISPGKYNQS